MAALKFLVIGGDLRQVHLANYLCDRGHSVITYGIDSAALSRGCIQTASFSSLMRPESHVVLPLPVTRDGSNLFLTGGDAPVSIEEFKAQLHPSNTVFGGVIPPGLARDLDALHVPYYDLMGDSAVAIRNGIATAEGAIAHAIMESDVTLHAAPTLVLGYGRCGKVLADKLKGMGADVTICTRNPIDLALGESLGYQILPFSKLKRNVGKYQFLFNTIPAPVLDAGVLDKVRGRAVIIDIASVPGGTDFNYAKKLGINAKLCLGIPGKTAARSSGEILASAILSNPLVKTNARQTNGATFA